MGRIQSNTFVHFIKHFPVQPPVSCCWPVQIHQIELDVLCSRAPRLWQLWWRGAGECLCVNLTDILNQYFSDGDVWHLTALVILRWLFFPFKSMQIAEYCMYQEGFTVSQERSQHLIRALKKVIYIKHHSNTQVEECKRLEAVIFPVTFILARRSNKCFLSLWSQSGDFKPQSHHV